MLLDFIPPVFGGGRLMLEESTVAGAGNAKVLEHSGDRDAVS